MATSTATSKRPASAGQKRKLNPIERIHLSQRVAVERAKRPATPWHEIAKSEGLPSSTVRYIHSRYEAFNDQYEDPLGLVERTLRLHEEAIELFAEEAANGDTSSARIGAARSMVAIAKEQLSLLVAVGKLPRDLSSAQDQKTMVETVESMAQVLERNNIPQAVIQELLEVVTPPTEPTQPLALTAGAPRRPR